MTSVELLNWARGPGLQIGVAIFVLGIVARLVEMWLIGRKTDLSVPRQGGFGPGLRTVFSRSLPAPGLMKRSGLVYIAGYVFHIGFLITLLFYAPHILLLSGAVGFSWPAVSNGVIDIAAIVSIAALVALLVHRIIDPVRRYLSGFGDYLSWAIATAPLVTGYMAFHHLWLPYTNLLTLHILTVELLLVLLPFTKLIHAVTFLISRGYNGAIAGRKGVQA
jgi:nitrate reductase gamma subunit